MIAEDLFSCFFGDILLHLEQRPLLFCTEEEVQHRTFAMKKVLVSYTSLDIEEQICSWPLKKKQLLESVKGRSAESVEASIEHIVLDISTDKSCPTALSAARTYCNRARCRLKIRALMHPLMQKYHVLRMRGANRMLGKCSIAERVAGVLKHYDFVMEHFPIIVRKRDDGKFEMVSGNHRSLATAILGKEVVPVLALVE